jgi:hypothetical protein
MNPDTGTPDVNSICGILVTLHVADEQVLYLMLATDGTIHRMGTGSESNVERDLFIGKSSMTAFEQLRKQMTPNLLQWLGQYSDPYLKGKRCRLTIGLRLSDGRELASQWQYGTQSQGPPDEICQFVTAAIDVTNSWYEQQKELVSRRKNQKRKGDSVD